MMRETEVRSPLGVNKQVARSSAFHTLLSSRVFSNEKGKENNINSAWPEAEAVDMKRR